MTTDWQSVGESSMKTVIQDGTISSRRGETIRVNGDDEESSFKDGLPPLSARVRLIPATYAAGWNTVIFD